MVRTPATTDIGRSFSFAETTSIERRLRKEIRRETTTMRQETRQEVVRIYLLRLELELAPSTIIRVQYQY